MNGGGAGGPVPTVRAPRHRLRQESQWPQPSSAVLSP